MTQRPDSRTGVQVPSMVVGPAFPTTMGDVSAIGKEIAADRLMFLLGYSLHRRCWRLQDALLDSRPGLLEALVPIFCEVVRRAIRPGLLQGYRTEESALQTVRGRIRFDDQIRNRFGLLPPIEVRYDEFTVDTPMNQLMKAAIHRLGALAIRSSRARNQLRHLAAHFRPVSLGPFDARRLPEFVYDRLTARYEPAIVISKLVLRATSVAMNAGPTAAPALLVDMNQVFEDFVVTALRDELALSDRRFPQNCRGHRLRLDIAGRVKLEPDLSWWEGSQCVFVGDAKYKRLEAKGFKHGDIYQMLAYCTATNLPGGLLVYAASEGEAATHEIVHAGKTIEVVHLDLAGSADQLLAQVAGLARRVTRWRDIQARFAV